MEIRSYSPRRGRMAYGLLMMMCNPITVPTKSFIAAIASILKRRTICVRNRTHNPALLQLGAPSAFWRKIHRRGCEGTQRICFIILFFLLVTISGSLRGWKLGFNHACFNSALIRVIRGYNSLRKFTAEDKAMSRNNDGDLPQRSRRITIATEVSPWATETFGCMGILPMSPLVVLWCGHLACFA